MVAAALQHVAVESHTMLMAVVRQFVEPIRQLSARICSALNDRNVARS
jgi:hypothetical protein